MSDEQMSAVLAHFASQAEACRSLGSPFTALVCELLGDRLDENSSFGGRILRWAGDPRADALALRACGGLNALARSGKCPELTEVYPPHESGREALWQGIHEAIRQHDGFLADYLDSPPQTNEVRRCSVLLGGALMVAKMTAQPLEILEIGASAGLNLGFDGYRYELGAMGWGDIEAPVKIRSEWRGARLPPLEAALVVAERQACDVNPLDPADDAHRARVMSYIWPDQADRIASTEAAFDVAATRPWHVERADAGDWVKARLAEPARPGRSRMLMHTIMWQYMPEATQNRIATAMARAGALADSTRPLAWLRMEADKQKASAAVTLTFWPGGEEREIARADFHGRWVDWR